MVLIKVLNLINKNLLIKKGLMSKMLLVVDLSQLRVWKKKVL